MKSTCLLKPLFIAAVFALSAASCTTGFFGAGDDAIAELAASVAAYDVSRTLDAASDTEAGVEPGLSSDAAYRGIEDLSASARLVEDLGDGTVRVTREWVRWNGVAMKRVAVRMKEPALDDIRWASGNIVDADATEELYMADLANPVSSARLTITWKKVDATVFVYSLLRDGERLRVNGDFVKTFTEWNADERIVNRRVEYLRIGASVAARTVTYAYTYEAGNVEPVQIRMAVDGVDGYALVLSVADPRIMEWYRDVDGNGTVEKVLRIEKTRDPDSRELQISRTTYAADGSILSTTSTTAKVTVVDGVIKVVRTRANGTVYRISVAETADGYSVDRNGTIYTIAVAEDGSMTITADGASWFVEADENGAWVVTRL